MTKASNKKTRSDGSKTTVSKKKAVSKGVGKARPGASNKNLSVKVQAKKKAKTVAAKKLTAAKIPSVKVQAKKPEVILTCGGCGKKVICEATPQDLRMSELHCPKCDKKIIPGASTTADTRPKVRATVKAPIKLTHRKPPDGSRQRSSSSAAAINRSPRKKQPGQKSEIMLSCSACGKRVLCEATREDLRVCELRCPKCGKKVIM